MNLVSGGARERFLTPAPAHSLASLAARAPLTRPTLSYPLAPTPFPPYPSPHHCAPVLNSLLSPPRHYPYNDTFSPPDHKYAATAPRPVSSRLTPPYILLLSPLRHRRPSQQRQQQHQHQQASQAGRRQEAGRQAGKQASKQAAAARSSSSKQQAADSSKQPAANRKQQAASSQQKAESSKQQAASSKQASSKLLGYTDPPTPCGPGCRCFFRII